jgi:hypothetical protein
MADFIAVPGSTVIHKHNFGISATTISVLYEQNDDE